MRLLMAGLSARPLGGGTTGRPAHPAADAAPQDDPSRRAGPSANLTKLGLLSEIELSQLASINSIDRTSAGRASRSERGTTWRAP
jgi:hypothetical protein